jgi:hypothetical protein
MLRKVRRDGAMLVELFGWPVTVGRLHDPRVFIAQCRPALVINLDICEIEATI